MPSRVLHMDVALRDLIALLAKITVDEIVAEQAEQFQPSEFALNQRNSLINRNKHHENASKS
jgi:hypothetical protein